MSRSIPPMTFRQYKERYGMTSREDGSLPTYQDLLNEWHIKTKGDFSCDHKTVRVCKKDTGNCKVWPRLKLASGRTRKASCHPGGPELLDRCKSYGNDKKCGNDPRCIFDQRDQWNECVTRRTAPDPNSAFPFGVTQGKSTEAVVVPTGIADMSGGAKRRNRSKGKKNSKSRSKGKKGISRSRSHRGSKKRSGK